MQAIRWILVHLLILGAPLARAQEPMGVVVGELQERWTFPSDHLPIGATVDGLKIASWNVLNTLFIEWIERNGQGLARSLLVAGQTLVNEEGLTRRDQIVADAILQMIQKGRQMIALQECSQPFIQELQRLLPSKMALILRSSPFSMDQEAIVYDTDVLKVDHPQTIEGIYSTHPKRKLMTVVFQRLDKHNKLSVVNVHIPGEPGGPAHFELARFVASCQGPCLALGDFNFDEQQMKDAFDGFSARGRLLSPYCTNIQPVVLRSRCLDHFYVSDGVAAALDPPEELVSGLSSMVDLLLMAELHSIN